MLRLVLFVLTAWSSFPLGSSARGLPAFPFLHLRHSLYRSLDQDSAEAQALKVQYPAFTFDQLSTHFSPHPPDGFNQTFGQRYWIDTSYYKPGGPVIVLDGGETSGEDRLPFLSTGIVRYLAEATGGVGIILEHRYYGESYLTSDLTPYSISLLTTAESLADNAYFADNFPYAAHPGLDSSILANSTPWITYGGSYAGGKAAFVRHLYPDQIWGSIASSGVVWANETFWEYWEPIRLNGEPQCIEGIETVVEMLDTAIEKAGVDENGIEIKSREVVGLMKLFELEELSVKEWMGVLSAPLSFWQARNWDMSLPSVHEWDDFCSNLTQGISVTQEGPLPAQVPFLADNNNFIGSTQFEARTQGKKREKYLANYAHYIKTRFTDWVISDRSSVEECFRTGNQTACNDTSLTQAYAELRLWYYQVCLEWGYYLTAPPPGHPTIISRVFQDVDLYNTACPILYGFDPSHRPNTTAINQYGNFSLTDSRILYVDGDQDPWLYATMHSPIAEDYRDPAISYDGILIPEAWHHSDEYGVGNITKEPDRIQEVHMKEIEVVKGWIKEWEEAKKGR